MIILFFDAFNFLQESAMKKVLGIQRTDSTHWVGDGFPVRSLFSYATHGKALSPFLLLDHAGPHAFSPTQSRRGVGLHPHRGFETVTIVYQGEVAHRDSSGGGGVIGPGDVQWMTAGAGIVHEEFHSPAFGRSGGTLEMVQLWINLPARHKLTPPRYQAIGDRQIPDIELPGGAGRMRIIAGAYDGRQGPAHAFTPLCIWDIRLYAGCDAAFSLSPGWTAAAVVLRGDVRVNGSATTGSGEMVVLDRDGEAVHVTASSDARVLLLSGEPIDEPIAGQGPFVMNTATEIRQAIHDWTSGRFGAHFPDRAAAPTVRD
jgi:redox-sensitive bicupin YhaK (pirin superfamily)